MMIDSPTGTVPRHLSRLCFVVLAAGVLFAAPAARAFTMDDGKGNLIPKFDLEEQSRQFKKPQLDLSTTDKKGLETPFGTLQFGVDKGSAFSSPFGPGLGANTNSNADRRHYERMFTPEYLQGGGRGGN
jgi:hypothetical protein